MKPNLLLIISNLSGGGAQRVVSVLSKGSSSYYNPHLILHDGSRIDYPYSGQVIDLETPVEKSMLTKIKAFFRRTWKVRSLKKALSPVAAISFLEGSNFVNLLSGKKGKTIISVRNLKSQQKRSWLGKLNHYLIRFLYKRSDNIVVPSEGIKADLVDNFGLCNEKIRVIYNPYDLDYLERMAGEPMVDWEKEWFEQPVIITAGNLSRQKGQWQLIRAFREVRERLPEARLVIIGEGGLRAYLEELVATYGLEDAVKLPGFMNNPFKLISRADVFVLPSLFEGFPNVLVEAMACGTPVIAADCPAGPREILAPGSGYRPQAEGVEWAKYGVLIPAGKGEKVAAEEPLSNEESLMAEAIIRMLTEQDLKDKYRNLSKARAADFAVEKICRQWVEIIEE